MHNSIIDIQISESSPTEPVTVQRVKDRLLITHTDDDDDLDDLITECRQEFESICNISIVQKNIVLIADWARCQKLPYPPVTSINDVKVKVDTNTDGSPEYDTPTTYSLDGGLFDMSGRYILKITYTTGMTTVSDELKKALLNLIAWRYENRGDHTKELSADVMRQILRFKDYSWT